MKPRIFKIFTTRYEAGWDKHLTGKVRDIYVADWSDADLELSTDALMAHTPPIAVFPVGQSQKDLDLKRAYANKLVAALNVYHTRLAEVPLEELA